MNPLVWFANLPMPVQIALVVGLLIGIAGIAVLVYVFSGRIAGGIGAVPRWTLGLVVALMVLVVVGKIFGGFSANARGFGLVDIKANPGQPLQISLAPEGKHTHAPSRVEGQPSPRGKFLESLGVSTVEQALLAAGISRLADPLTVEVPTRPVTRTMAYSGTVSALLTPTVTAPVTGTAPLTATSPITVAVPYSGTVEVPEVEAAGTITDVLQALTLEALRECRTLAARSENVEADVAVAAIYLQSWTDSLDDRLGLEGVKVSGRDELRACADSVVADHRWIGASKVYVRPPTAIEFTRDAASVRAAATIAIGDFWDLSARLPALTDEEVVNEAYRQLDLLTPAWSSGKQLQIVVRDVSKSPDAANPCGYAAAGFDQNVFNGLCGSLADLQAVRGEAPNAAHPLGTGLQAAVAAATP